MQKSVSKTLWIWFLSLQRAIIPGPPFLVGACIVLLAFLVALFIPEHSKASSTRKHSSSISSALSSNLDRSSEEDIEPLLQDSSVWRPTSEETVEPGHALNCSSGILVGCTEYLACERKAGVCSGKSHAVWHLRLISYLQEGLFSRTGHN